MFSAKIVLKQHKKPHNRIKLFYSDIRPCQKCQKAGCLLPVMGVGQWPVKREVCQKYFHISSTATHSGTSGYDQRIWGNVHQLIDCRVATKIFEDFGGVLCKEFIKDPLSIEHYTRPGTCIKHPLH